MAELAAIIFGLLSAGIIAFHVALLFGAPLGHLTMGGVFPGRLHGWRRLLPVVQAIIVAAMAAVLLAKAGWLDLALPTWAIWPVTVLSVLSVIGNLATPSPEERRLWAPVTIIMLICVFTVLFGA